MKRIHFIFKGEWMKKADWLDEEVDWNDLIVIMISPLPPEKRPYDWLFCYSIIKKGTSKKAERDEIMETWKAMWIKR